MYMLVSQQWALITVERLHQERDASMILVQLLVKPTLIRLLPYAPYYW